MAKCSCARRIGQKREEITPHLQPQFGGSKVEGATITTDSAAWEAAIGSIDWMTFNRSTDAERAATRPKFEATINEMLARTETALRGGAKIVAWQEESA